MGMGKNKNNQNGTDFFFGNLSFAWKNNVKMRTGIKERNGPGKNVLFCISPWKDLRQMWLVL
jgi:hypothetical protein